MNTSSRTKCFALVATSHHGSKCCGQLLAICSKGSKNALGGVSIDNSNVEIVYKQANLLTAIERTRRSFARFHTFYEGKYSDKSF